MFTFEAMNTSFLLAGLPEAVCDKIQAFISSAETVFSRFNPNSEINKVNSNKGQWVPVTPLTFALLQDTLDAYFATEGLFSPFLGAVLQKFGYDQSFEKLPAVSGWPSVKYSQSDSCPIALAIQQNALPVYLELDNERYMVRLSPAVTLDLGGIAKGWSAQYAYKYCSIKGVNQGLIDAGGDIILWGNAPKQKFWGVGVAHPCEPDIDIAELWLNGIAAIATSNTVKRRWQTPYHGCAHHIIDPRTQAPAASDLLQVTILARNLAVAEQYTQCLLILGSAGIAWIKGKRPDLAYITVSTDGRIFTSENLRMFCSELEVSRHICINY